MLLRYLVVQVRTRVVGLRTTLNNLFLYKTQHHNCILHAHCTKKIGTPGFLMLYVL